MRASLLFVSLAALLGAAACDSCAPTTPAGTVPEGEECVTTSECEDGLTCSVDDVCAADVGCQTHDQCGSGAFCGDAEECVPNTLGGPCVNNDNCIAPEECAGGVCAQIIDEGGTCNGAAACEGDLVCAPDTDVCTDDVGCTTHADCGLEAVCDNGTCRKAETEDGCDIDDRCAPSDRCFGGVCIPDQCEAEEFLAEAVPPNILITLDRSGSMEERVGGFGSDSKWEVALDAVDTLLAQYGDQITFGLYLFPGSDQDCDQGGQCQPGVMAVDVGSPASDITSYLANAGTCRFGTPIKAALDDIADYAGLEDPSKSNYVLLITDGEDNCGSRDPEVEVALLRQESPEIQTYVVGFGGGVDPSQLNAMADEGGNALSGNTRYYQADDAAQLDQALATIGGDVLGCDYAIPSAVPDPDQLFVFFDGIRVPRDATGTTGWDYDAGTSRLQFAGNACTALRTGNVEQLILVYGCPGQLPPDPDAGPQPPPDGGPPPPVDAGPPGGDCNDVCDPVCGTQACLVDQGVCGACSDDGDCCPGEICLVGSGECINIGG
jgi:hypothetical protein